MARHACSGSPRSMTVVNGRFLSPITPAVIEALPRNHLRRRLAHFHLTTDHPR